MYKYIISSLVILFLTSVSLEAEISKVFEFTNNELENLKIRKVRGADNNTKY